MDRQHQGSAHENTGEEPVLRKQLYFQSRQTASLTNERAILLLTFSKLLINNGIASKVPYGWGGRRCILRRLNRVAEAISLINPFFEHGQRMGHWESAGIPADFDGVVRLFPLPNMVLFPHVIQALHIFEPRYCEMLTEALESDHLITMALLVPGWESQFQGKPNLGNTVCIGRIISHTPTDDGRHNILMAGLQRARIIEELEVDTTFRQARVELIPDIVPDDFRESADVHRATLLSLFRAMIPQDAANSKTFADLLTQQLPIGILTDIIAYAVNLPVAVKQLLLGEANVQIRFETLLVHLEPILASSQDRAVDNENAAPHSQWNKIFPPPFSNN